MQILQMLMLRSFKNFKKDFIYLFLERGEGREKEREKYQCVVASHVAPTGDLACNPGMCPDWESNWQPFGLQPTLNPLSYASQGFLALLINYLILNLWIHLGKKILSLSFCLCIQPFFSFSTTLYIFPIKLYTSFA